MRKRNTPIRMITVRPAQPRKRMLLTSARGPFHPSMPAWLADPAPVPNHPAPDLALLQLCPTMGVIVAKSSGGGFKNVTWQGPK